MTQNYKRQWRDYRTATGARPVKNFIDSLDKFDRLAIYAAMGDVRESGLRSAKHLRGDIWEVRADGLNNIYRVLFATEGRYSQVLLSLEAFAKKTQKTPSAKLSLADRRFRDWRSRSKPTVDK